MSERHCKKCGVKLTQDNQYPCHAGRLNRCKECDYLFQKQKRLNRYEATKQVPPKINSHPTV